MPLIDLSQPVFHGAPHCPVHPPVSVRITVTHETAGWHMEEIAMATHTGSHLDAPLHKIRGGASIDQIPLESFAGPAVVFALGALAPSTPITAALLAACSPVPLTELRGQAVLLATGWGNVRAQDDRWENQSPFLHPDGATWLVDQGVRGVGIDHFSIGGMQPENETTHTLLLGAGVWILEDLCFPPVALALRHSVRLWCLPLNWPGCSGSFCRPVLEIPDAHTS